MVAKSKKIAACIRELSNDLLRTPQSMYRILGVAYHEVNVVRRYKTGKNSLDDPSSAIAYNIPDKTDFHEANFIIKKA